jgi:hypothetical protein
MLQNLLYEEMKLTADADIISRPSADDGDVKRYEDTRRFGPCSFKALFFSRTAAVLGPWNKAVCGVLAEKLEKSQSTGTWLSHVDRRPLRLTYNTLEWRVQAKWQRIREKWRDIDPRIIRDGDAYRAETCNDIQTRVDDDHAKTNRRARRYMRRIKVRQAFPTVPF